MQGYDQERALAYIRRNINRKDLSELGPALDDILKQAQALDLQYMREAEVLDEEGYEGDGFYDEDEAFEYIVEEIVKTRGLDDDAAIVVASAVDGYMQAQEAFLHQEGLAW